LRKATETPDTCPKSKKVGGELGSKPNFRKVEVRIDKRKGPHVKRKTKPCVGSGMGGSVA